MKFNKSRQAGFTLVEIAIVLVIIGLLLGGVLKGQEMIDNSRIKSVVGDLNGVSSAYNSYLDRYHATAGDEIAAVMAARGWAPTNSGNGDGVLEAAPGNAFINAFGAAVNESPAFWDALRAAGFITGSPTQPANVTALPRTGTGGLIGVAQSPYGFSGVAGCVSGLTTKQAAGVDTAIDGPLSTVAPNVNVGNNIGSVRGDTGPANPFPPALGVPAAKAYNETATVTTWTLCRTL